MLKLPINSNLIIDVKLNSYTNSTLELREEDLTDEDIYTLADALNHNQHIKYLRLSNNNISDASVSYLAKKIPNQLEELDISENNIGKKGCIALSKTSLKKIDISANPVEDAIAEFATSSVLRELSAFECQITDIGAEKLFSSRSIVILDLGSNAISGACLKSLPQNNVLEKLKLLQNPIEEEYCCYIAENKSLSHLDLTNTYLGDAAAAFLAQNSSLESLFLSECLVKNTGAIALSENKTLKELLLEGNRISDEGAKALANNTSLCRLNLNRNLISDDGIADLKKQYKEGERYLIFIRTPEDIEALLKKRNIHEITHSSLLSSSSSAISNLRPSCVEPSNVSLSFIPYCQSTQFFKEEIGQLKAQELLSNPEFKHFFKTTDEKQIESFFKYIEEYRKKSHKNTHPHKRRKLSDSSPS